MATIRQNATDLMEAVKKEAEVIRKTGTTTPGSTFIRDLRVAAVKATLGGVRSDDWRAFMTLFADNEKQLQRLTASDAEAGKDYVLESCAYLAGGSICTDPTTGHLLDRLDKKLDEGLDPKGDGKIKKLFKIPKP